MVIAALGWVRKDVRMTAMYWGEERLCHWWWGWSHKFWEHTDFCWLDTPFMVSFQWSARSCWLLTNWHNLCHSDFYCQIPFYTFGEWGSEEIFFFVVPRLKSLWSSDLDRLFLVEPPVDPDRVAYSVKIFGLSTVCVSKEGRKIIDRY